MNDSDFVQSTWRETVNERQIRVLLLGWVGEIVPGTGPLPVNGPAAESSGHMVVVDVTC